MYFPQNKFYYTALVCLTVLLPQTSLAESMTPKSNNIQLAVLAPSNCDSNSPTKIYKKCLKANEQAAKKRDKAYKKALKECKRTNKKNNKQNAISGANTPTPTQLCIPPVY